MTCFSVRELFGLLAIEAITAAAAKKCLAADSAEEVVFVLGLMIVAAIGYCTLVLNKRRIIPSRKERDFGRS